MTFKVVIPARYGSTRLPGKPLIEIAGRPMIQWVIEAARRSAAEEVWVATDDARIAAVAGALAVMTSPDHESGTDRIAEVAQARGWDEQAVVVNVQGDEPQLPPALIDQVATLLLESEQTDIATLCTPILNVEELLNPNIVKVVSSSNGDALYFSRAPIPWCRDGARGGLTTQTQHVGAQRHLGIYAYRLAALRRLSGMPLGELEAIEKLEQLRALQAGMRIKVAMAERPPPAGIDTAEDLARVRSALERS